MSALDIFPLWLRALLHPPQHATPLFPEPDQAEMRALNNVRTEALQAREVQRMSLLRYRHFE